MFLSDLNAYYTHFSRVSRLTFSWFVPYFNCLATLNLNNDKTNINPFTAVDAIWHVSLITIALKLPDQLTKTFIVRFTSQGAYPKTITPLAGTGY